MTDPRKLLKLERAETLPVAIAFVYFFCLLCSYYILRPVRDTMGIQAGIENLQWLFTGTFVAMLAVVPVFGAAVARFPRRVLLPAVYGFFIANIIAFAWVFQVRPDHPHPAITFFIWLSVFNLFVVSVFWSFMADIFSNAQAKRLFGLIAAGGSAGAIAGPALTAALASRLGIGNLLFISAGFLTVALGCVVVLGRLSRPASPGEDRPPERPIGGSIWAGVLNVARSRYLLGICLYIVLFTTLSTFLYFMQAELVRDAFATPESRTTVFAAIDLAVNVLTISLQVLLTGRLMTRFGLPVALALVPALVVCGFVALAFAPVLATLIVVQVIRRAGNYAIARPAREVLFTVVDREDKYKAKNFIDTVVYRGGDALSGWAYAGLGAVGAGLSTIAVIGAALGGVWLIVGGALGRQHDRRASNVMPISAS